MLASQPGEIVYETLLQNNTEPKKELVEWLKWESACLASVRPGTAK
jgi:hypothetical protein